MPQLNLKFAEIPLPETHIWNQLDDEQQQILVEALARLIEKAARIHHAVEANNE